MSIQFETKGKVYMAGKSECLPVKLAFSNVLVVTLEDDAWELDYEELNIASKISSVPREITLPNNALLVVDTSPEVDAWLDGSDNSGKLNRMEKSRTGILLSIVLVPISLWGIFKYLLPGLAIMFASVVPDSVVDLGSRHTLYAMDKSLLEPSKLSQEQQQEYLDSWYTLINTIDTEHLQYNIEFRDSPEMGANAFALPNGTIIFTDDLVELVDNNADLLTAILLHEIGHVEQHHSMRLIAETLIASLAIDYFLGDMGAMIELIGGLGNTVVQNQFSQKLEWEADNYALAQLDALSLSREHFAQAMEKLAEQGPDEAKMESLLSSHPLLRARIENARQGQVKADD